MKKEYIFLVQIAIILYLLYLIIGYKYKEYLISNYIESTTIENQKQRAEIQKTKEMLEYIDTKAFKNKILKEEQALKNKGEVIINITNEDKFNTYSKEENNIENKKVVIEKKRIQDSMSVFEKWMYFLFQKDIR